MTTSGSSGYWFPRRMLHTGHFPAWCWLFPPFWLLLVPIYAGWLLVVAAVFLVTIPVNLILFAARRREPKPRYDVYTGKPL